MNADGLVDFADFREWKSNVPGVGSNFEISVPEPASYMLVFGMGLGMRLWPRRLRRSGPITV